MDYLPLYLGGFGILVLGLVGFAWYQNERLKKKFIEQARQAIADGEAASYVENQLTGQGLERAQAARIIELAQKRVHVLTALELLQQGMSEEVVKERLLERGIHGELADEIIGSAQFTKFCVERPVTASTLGIVLPLLGIALIAAGLFLWYGNKSGLFVTFPYAGHFVIVIGVTLFAGGAAMLVRVMKG